MDGRSKGWETEKAGMHTWGVRVGKLEDCANYNHRWLGGEQFMGVRALAFTRMSERACTGAVCARQSAADSGTWMRVHLHALYLYFILVLVRTLMPYTCTCTVYVDARAPACVLAPACVYACVHALALTWLVVVAGDPFQGREARRWGKASNLTEEEEKECHL